MLFGVTCSHSSSGALMSSNGAPGRPSCSCRSPVSTSVPSVPVICAKCPGPGVAAVVSVIVAIARPVSSSTQLAQSSAVTRRRTPCSSARSGTRVATRPLTSATSLAVQNRHRSIRCDPTAPRMPPPRAASYHQFHGASRAPGRPSPRTYGRSASSRCSTAPIAPA